MLAWPNFLLCEVAHQGQSRVLISALLEFPESPAGPRDMNVEEEI